MNFWIEISNFTSRYILSNETSLRETCLRFTFSFEQSLLSLIAIPASEKIGETFPPAVTQKECLVKIQSRKAEVEQEQSSGHLQPDYTKNGSTDSTAEPEPVLQLLPVSISFSGMPCGVILFQNPEYILPPSTSLH